jgi:sugar-specific transcriptional regulator TrmB
VNPKRSPLSAEEQEKAKTLYASGKTIHGVAQALNRSSHTLKRFLHKPEIVKEVGVQREIFAEMFDSITDRTLRGVTDEDIKKSSLLQKMTAAGITIDKALLLRNQPTTIVDVRILLDVAGMIRRDDAEKQEEYLQRQQQHALPAPTA